MCDNKKQHAKPKNLLQHIFIIPIKIYQIVLSPWLGSNCRHHPTCSNYAIQAIQEWGIFKGIYLGIKRILKCHPWGTFGYDPVPKKNTKQ